MATIITVGTVPEAVNEYEVLRPLRREVFIDSGEVYVSFGGCVDGRYVTLRLPADTAYVLGKELIAGFEQTLGGWD